MSVWSPDFTYGGVTYRTSVRELAAADVVVLKDTGFTLAFDAKTGNMIARERNDDASVIQSGIDYIANRGGGKIYISNGTYNILQLIKDTSGYNYGIKIPKPIDSSNPYTIIIEGATLPPTTTLLSNASPSTNGVILYVTEDALNNAQSLNRIAIWAEPPDSGMGNYVIFRNINVMFPNNQYNSIQGINLENTESMWLENILVNFKENPSNFAPAYPGSGIIHAGISTTASSHHQVYMNMVRVIGFRYGFLLQSEHTVGAHLTSQFCVRPFWYGKDYSIYHPSILIDFHEAECPYGPQFGIGIREGAVLDLIAYDIEYTDSGTWSRLGGAIEDNPNYLRGHIYYSVVKKGVGVETTYFPFWDSGYGGNTITKQINVITENSGKATFSGDGTTTTFTIAHGLVSTPSSVRVTPCSADASGDFYVTADATNITVTYGTAPPSGTDNVCLYWEAEV